MPRKLRIGRNNINRKLKRTTAMLSDDESMSDGVDVPEVVPAKASKAKGKGKAPAKPVSEDEQEDGSDDEEEAEDEYSVDKILEHRFERGGVVKYKVKWLGYEDEADMTWEPAANL
jgi:chromobox protein 1